MLVRIRLIFWSHSYVNIHYVNSIMERKMRIWKWDAQFGKVFHTKLSLKHTF